jgi:hypothetical protein
MSRGRAAGRAVWDFVVGDDWRIAAGVVIGLALTALAAGASISAWWIPPVVTWLLLILSVWPSRRARRSR